MSKYTLAEIKANRPNSATFSFSDYVLYLIYQNNNDSEQNGILVDAVSEILNTLNKTNSQVSIKEFDCSGTPQTSAFSKYDAWVTANPDWHVVNEIYYPNPTDGDLQGTPIIMIRYTGEKFSSDQ